MGTRSLTWVYDTYTNEDGNKQHEPIIKLYRQYDGYVSGHGLELAEWLSQYRVVNGLGLLDEGVKVANGMGCLAAQLVANFKDGPGQFYLYAPVLGRDNWQEYEYHIYADKVLVERTEGTFIFEGTWLEFNKFCLEEALAEEKARG
jgi:hypothetical protein